MYARFANAGLSPTGMLMRLQNAKKAPFRMFNVGFPRQSPRSPNNATNSPLTRTGSVGSLVGTASGLPRRFFAIMVLLAGMLALWSIHLSVGRSHGMPGLGPSTLIVVSCRDQA